MLKRLMLSAVCVLGALAAPLAPARAEPDPEVSVTITEGPIVGTRKIEDGIYRFFGIPYAAPPIGAWRWRPPQDPPRHVLARERTAFGPACPQTDNYFIITEISEDCLSLNVWTKSLASEPAKPVFVWVHGGSYNTGSSQYEYFDGTDLAQDGAVVISINYRLGLLGYFAHPDLVAEARLRREPHTNYAAMDVLKALDWVRANAATFGGNPNNITLAGESAGAGLISGIASNRQNDGLFEKIIVQSGNLRFDFERFDATETTFRSTPYEQSQALVEALGFQDALSPILRLRFTDWKDILAARELNDALRTSRVFVDGQVITQDPLTALANNTFSRRPLLVGANRNDGNPLRIASGLTPATVFAIVGPDNVATFRRIYETEEGRQLNDSQVADRIYSGAFFVEPVRWGSRQKSALGEAVYSYSFDYTPPNWVQLGGQAPHGYELLYVFGTLDNPTWGNLWGITDEALATSTRVRRYWLNFMTTGNPNGPGLVTWPRFNADGRERHMVFTSESESVVDNYRKEALDFHETVYNEFADQF